MATTLEKTRQCCKNPKFFLILFDGAGTADLPILVCKDCSQKNLFQKFIKKRMTITKATDISTILKKIKCTL